MRKFLLALLIFLLWALFALWFHQTQSNKFCDACTTPHDTLCEVKKDVNKVETDANDENIKTAFSIANLDGKSIFNFPEGFITNSKNGNIEIPNNIAGFKDSIFNYLNLHQGKELLLKAKYLSSEVTGDINWGMSRAQFLKNVLIKSGINGDRIVSEAVLSEYNYSANGISDSAISLHFRNISEEHLAEIEGGIANKTLYSNFGDAEFKADRNLQGYAFGLKNYLVKYPEKSISVTGHTDNVGEEQPNYNLGLKRANQVKDYLASQGVSLEKLNSGSKGETDPIATNDTEQGRALNRRIQITVN
ncbi:MAG: hypothetical protein COA67_12010 [Lutibacter sp.]|nr:MAG: hypothetical protein COA67_12010 [Lutibacter sp.]